jgi:hypothetical protein
MLKKTLSFLIIAPFFVACTAEGQPVKEPPLVTAERIPQGYVLSVNAVSVPFARLLRDLARQCQVSIARRGGDHLPQSISIRFKDLPLEQAIKKLLKAGGINNYLIRYSDRGTYLPLITEVIIFGGSGRSEAAGSTAHSPAGSEQHGLSAHHKMPPSGQDAFSEQLASFKERYVWENQEMLNRAVCLLEAMPDEAKALGLEGIMRELDRSSSPEGREAVDEELFYRAIEAAAPPGLAPVMMKQVRRLSEGYKNGRAVKEAETADDELFQGFTAEGRK